MWQESIATDVRAVDPHVSGHTNSAFLGLNLSIMMSCDSSLASYTGCREPSNRLLHVLARSVVSHPPYYFLDAVALSSGSTLQNLYVPLLGGCSVVVLHSAIDRRSQTGI